MKEKLSNYRLPRVVMRLMDALGGNKNYWLCQIGGWGAFVILYTFFYFTFRPDSQKEPHFFSILYIDAILGVVSTHLMRGFVIKANLLKLNFDKQVIYVLLMTLFFAFFFASACVIIENRLHLLPAEGHTQAEKIRYLTKRVVLGSYGSFLFLTIWNLLYFTYHYIEKSRQEQIDKVSLQGLVKELELKTIKAHINPHFIFNALNSIRALVDENPQRARQAITELSNILRSSMTVEKVETTPLSKELNIVRDYLALEHIRFEDRLNVEYEIDAATLNQPVPPMMLQTLVENAIKHGISKKTEGGVIKIVSEFRDNHHELTVKNTGYINGSYNHDGFGLSSTQSRLSLLYGDKASFQIKNNGDNMVEAVVLMPA